MREHVSQSKKATTASFSIPSLKHRIPGFGLDSSQASPQAVPLVQPLHKPLTHDISRIPLRNPQAKLTIGEPEDKYEQEADSVAQQVMQRMAQPVNRQSIQRVAFPEESELQMKPLANSITPLVQREEMPEEEEELQMKSLDNSTLQRQQAPESESELQMKSMVQRRAEARMADAPDLEASINQARGGGQAMADNIRHPMEVAFGADFSGVKVHTDSQSDQLNRSIQARAFTTGQDVFFRQGEYNPGSRGGQELLAHELTHVVQQNGGVVQRSPQQAADFAAISKHRGTTPPEIQLYSPMEASELIQNQYKDWKQWYYEVCVPAMQTIAARGGQNFDQYLLNKTQQQFEQEMSALHTEAKDERSFKEKFKEQFSTDNSLVRSETYPQMNRVSGTNILVSTLISADDNKLQQFINLYRSGGMIWYRGLSISHFSYNQLQTTGVLGSEGTVDTPTFTMGNASSSIRWLPGIYEPDTADYIAQSVDKGDAGIRDIIMRKDIPIGVTVQYPIRPQTPIAYLNDGEQVARGPITGATVYRVILLGPSGYTYRLMNGSTNELPPAAPYLAGVGSAEIVAWEALIDAWLLKHTS
ncbi:eCIS core domain-containing protein [Nostoc sp.]|uniref:eCIS core domain-containing protein n=1 Tax=Nostoc sp. TaxID=1180 RepID=UPI002FF68257